MYSRIMRLSLWATNRAKKGQTDPGSALLYSHLDGARVARQHCSTLRLGNTILSLPCPAWIGHFYFGLTLHCRGAAILILAEALNWNQDRAPIRVL